MKTTALFISIALGTGLASAAYAEITTSASDVEQKAKIVKRHITEPAPALSPIMPAPTPAMAAPPSMLPPTINSHESPVVVAPHLMAPPLSVPPPTVSITAPPAVIAPPPVAKMLPPLPAITTPTVFTPPVIPVAMLGNLVNNTGVTNIVSVIGNPTAIPPTTTQTILTVMPPVGNAAPVTVETIVTTIGNQLPVKTVTTTTPQVAVGNAPPVSIVSTVKTVGIATPVTSVATIPTVVSATTPLAITAPVTTVTNVTAVPILQGGTLPTSATVTTVKTIGTLPPVTTVTTLPATTISIPNKTMASDRRLKTNIHRIGTHRLGIGIYEYDYVWGEHAVGVMADEVKAVMPDAVIRGEDGYDRVDYSKLN